MALIGSCAAAVTLADFPRDLHKLKQGRSMAAFFVFPLRVCCLFMVHRVISLFRALSTAPLMNRRPRNVVHRAGVDAAVAGGKAEAPPCS